MHTFFCRQLEASPQKRCLQQQKCVPIHVVFSNADPFLLRREVPLPRMVFLSHLLHPRVRRLVPHVVYGAAAAMRRHSHII